jgi:hypothetical protein
MFHELVAAGDVVHNPSFPKTTTEYGAALMASVSDDIAKTIVKKARMLSIPQKQIPFTSNAFTVKCDAAGVIHISSTTSPHVWLLPATTIHVQSVQSVNGVCDTCTTMDQYNSSLNDSPAAVCQCKLTS